MAVLIRTLLRPWLLQSPRQLLGWGHRDTFTLCCRFHSQATNWYRRFYQWSPKIGQLGGVSWALGGIAVGGLSLGIGYYYREVDATVDTSVVVYSSGDSARERNVVPAGQWVEGLPQYSLEEISGHSSMETGVWVVFRDGVYNVTDFVEQHLGGEENIMMAEGKFLDECWSVYTSHDQLTVYQLLEEMRIGNLDPADSEKRPTTEPGSVYGSDPPCSPLLTLHGVHPYHAETPLGLLGESYLTPNDIFFINHHLPVPDIHPQSYVLEVGGEGLETVRLSLDDIKTKFPQHIITATLQCAGNRRHDMSVMKQILSVPHWKGGAMGTAEWKGVLLRDVLLYCGVQSGDTAVQHIHLEGLDTSPLTGEHYGVSIPISQALDPHGDCLIAYQMNGVELPRNHGYPVRAVIPGSIGARNVKWLGRIEASREEYDGYWQNQDYKLQPSSPALHDWPIQSLICSPHDGDTLESSKEVTVKGVAWSGGGRAVTRVDVSIDGGKTWHTAEVGRGAGQRPERAWAWVMWEAMIELPKGWENQTLEVCCSAIDVLNHVQPPTFTQTWNQRGFLANAWSRVRVKVPASKQ